MKNPEQHILKDNGIFPNSRLPVLHYKDVVELPWLFPATSLWRLFQENGWTNNWRNGIYTYHHYHSNTHEVLGVVRGKTTLQLGGEDGIEVRLEKGDLLVIPAGVAHRNLGKEKDVICVGGYPEGKNFDMNYGNPDERPQTDRNIASLQVPATDPVFGGKGPLVYIWDRLEEEK